MKGEYNLITRLDYIRINMDDSKMKSMLAALVKNKDIIIAFLRTLDPDEIEAGKLNLAESLVNIDLRDYILKRTNPYLSEYRLSFNNNEIILGGSIDAKQLGEIALMYKMTVTEFDFKKNVHRIKLKYEEHAEARGNALQSMAFKTAGIGGSYLKIAMDMIKIDFIDVSNDIIEIDIDKASFASKIPPELMLKYDEADNGLLKFFFSWVQSS